MRYSMRLAAFTVLFWFVAESFADQWAWLKKDQADAALKILKPGTVILDWCEPCGDRFPILGKVWTIDTIGVVPEKDGHNLLYINGNEDCLDLAYVYVLMEGHRFDNVAIISGWPTESVQRTAVPSHEYHRTPDDEPLPEKTIQENAWRLRVLDLAGIWKSNQVVTASTCPFAKKGDRRQAQWKFKLRGGRLEVQIHGAKQDPAYYEATLEKTGNLLVLGTGSEEEELIADESLEFPLKGDFRNLKGRRVSENRSPACKVEFEVALAKK